jgi:hypothetical protein
MYLKGIAANLKRHMPYRERKLRVRTGEGRGIQDCRFDTVEVEALASLQITSSSFMAFCRRASDSHASAIPCPHRSAADRDSTAFVR